MNVTLFDPPVDYPELCKWWDRRGVPHVPQSILPSHGAVVSAGAPIAMGFCYFDTGGKIGVVDFISTNPAVAASSTTLEAIATLFKFFEQIAKKRDCPNLISFVAQNTGLHRYMVKAGWTDPRAVPHVYLLKHLT